MRSKEIPEPYVARLRRDLVGIRSDFAGLLDMSQIEYVNPNSPALGVYFVMAADWGWANSDPALSAAQMVLLGRYGAWFERFVLVFPQATPDVRSRIEETDAFVRRWVERDGTDDHTSPGTIDEAKKMAAERLDEFDRLLDVAEHLGDATLRLVPDTTALLRQPAVEEYAAALGATKCVVHVVTTVLAELDELKDRGRTEDVRDRAARAVRRLKGLRDRGSLAEGVTVSGGIRLRLEHREVECRSVLSWLDPAVPDDRIVAAALRLQSDNPAGAVVLITGDINLQNKADAVGLPYADPPSPIRGSSAETGG